METWDATVRLFAVHEHSERTGVPVAEVLGAVEEDRARGRARARDARGQTSVSC